MPSKPVNGEHRGWIIPIGGAEDKDTNPRILARFVELSGGADADIFDRAMDVQISRLRKKLDDNPETPTRIKTVRGKGYLFSRSDWE